MKTVIASVACGLCIAVGGAIVIGIIPALKGPVNRAKNTANEYLSDEFVVDNYKAEAQSLVSRRKSVAKNIAMFMVQLKVAEKRLEYATAKEETSKINLLATGTADLAKFNRAKDAYEISKTQVSNLTTLANTYRAAITKLEDARAMIDANIAKCRLNVATLESKKAMASSLKQVNETIENLQGVGGDDSLCLSLEKLDDTILEESIKVEALGKPSTVGSQADAEVYLQALAAQQE